MVSTCIFALLSITCVLICSSTDITRITNKHRRNSLPLYSYERFHGTRQRRTLIGPRVEGLALAETAIRRVLKMAKQIFTDGYNKVYLKPGGHQKCYEDFYSVSPTKVTNINEHTIAGRVGNLKITMEEKSHRIILILRQDRGSYPSEANPDLDYFVVYKH